MYVVLTSKVEEYNARPENGLTIVKSFDYYFYNKRKAVFSIARVDSEKARVSIVETDEKGCHNSIPIKFFETFESLEAAEEDLAHLTQSSVMEVDLRPVAID